MRKKSPHVGFHTTPDGNGGKSKGITFNSPGKKPILYNPQYAAKTKANNGKKFNIFMVNNRFIPDQLKSNRYNNYRSSLEVNAN